MVGLGTIINTAAILAGGLCGVLFGRVLGQSAQDTLMKGCGVSTLLIGISGVMEGMLTVEAGKITSGGALLMIGCLAVGGVIGELLNIEGAFERLGQWLKIKSGNARDKDFVNAFVSASLTVCIGAMAVVGSIQDGLTGNYSILATKAVLDMIIIMVMSSSMGKGAVFSAIPVAVPGVHHGPFGAGAAHYDRGGAGQPVAGWQCADLLRRHQPDLGKDNKGGEPAACHCHCSGSGVCAVLTAAEFG